MLGDMKGHTLASWLRAVREDWARFEHHRRARLWRGLRSRSAAKREAAIREVREILILEALFRRSQQ